MNWYSFRMGVGNPIRLKTREGSAYSGSSRNHSRQASADMVRLSTGIENPDDLIRDFTRALAQV